MAQELLDIGKRRHDTLLARCSLAAHFSLPAYIEPNLRSAVNRRHKPRAVAVDQERTS